MNMDICDQIFDGLDNCDDKDQFRTLITPLVNFYDPLTFTISADSLWRARLIKDKQPFKKTSEMSYPPKELTKAGRLNCPGKPMFYAAFDKETAIAEINPQVGDLIQLARFNLPPENEMKIGLVGEYFYVKRNDQNFIREETIKALIKKELNSYSEEDKKTMAYIDKCFFDIITNPLAQSAEYVFSRQLKDLIYEKLRNNIDAFIYRSCKPSGGFNIAIDPVHINNSITQVGCWIFEITKLRRYGMLDYKQINAARGINELEEFLWQFD